MSEQFYYVAKGRLYHSRENRYVEPGERVDLSHLDEDTVQALVDLGAVERRPVRARARKKEVTEDAQGNA